MPYEVQETGNLTRLVTVTLPAQERQERIQQELRRLSKTVKLRGFRKGKIPLAVMKQRYGEGVAQETLETLTREYMGRIVDEAERPVLHLGTPQFDALPASDDDDFSFTVDLELQPEIDPVGYLGLALEREKIEVDAAEIDQRLEQLREQFATLEPIVLRETIADGDQVTFDFEALGTDEEPALEAFKGEGAVLLVGAGNEAVQGLNEGLRGLPLQGTHTLTVTPGAGFAIAEAVDKPVQLQVTIQEVKRRVLPELDDEFAKDTELAQTLLELRTKLREEAEAELEHGAMHDLEEQAIEKLLAQNPLELPPKFVEEQVEGARNQRLRAIQQMIQQGGRPEQLGIDLGSLTDIEKLRPEVEANLREEMLLRAIFTKEGLELKEADLLSTITHQAMHQGVRPEQLMQAVVKSQESMAQLSQIAALEKARAFLVEKADIQEVEPGTLSKKGAGEDAGDNAEAPAPKPAAKKAASRKKTAEPAAAEEAPAGEEPQEKPKKKTSTKTKSAKARAAEPDAADADKESDAE